MIADHLRKKILTGVRDLAARHSLRVLWDLAAARGLQVYLVGGSVRELALGREAPVEVSRLGDSGQRHERWGR